MNILVSGLLWSGSSAVIDMLREYDEVGLVPGEFNEFRRPGMVGDHLAARISPLYPSHLPRSLQQSLPVRKLARALATFRFGRAEWRHIRRVRALRRVSEQFDGCGETHEARLAAARAWISELRMIFADSRRFLAFDQPILCGQHQDLWPEVFRPFKLVVVYRDPRDQLAEIIRQKQLFLHMRSPTADLYGGDRLGAVKFQIDTLNVRLRHFDALRARHGADQVAMFSFERFVTDHAAMRSQLARWLGLGGAGRSGAVLRPERSQRNIGIFDQWLYPEEVELLDPLCADYSRRERENGFN